MSAKRHHFQLLNGRKVVADTNCTFEEIRRMGDTMATSQRHQLNVQAFNEPLNKWDFLGSFMGMRLKREAVGDIVVSEGIAQAFVTQVAARLITSETVKIGRVGVKITGDRPFELEQAQQYKEISGTVASLRLDCVVAMAANISREKSAALIRSDKVEVNHFLPSGISHELREGDVLSIRGSGRFILSGIGGETKKCRVHINLRKFI